MCGFSRARLKAIVRRRRPALARVPAILYSRKSFPLKSSHHDAPPFSHRRPVGRRSHGLPERAHRRRDRPHAGPRRARKPRQEPDEGLCVRHARPRGRGSRTRRDGDARRGRRSRRRPAHERRQRILQRHAREERDGRGSARNRPLLRLRARDRGRRRARRREARRSEDRAGRRFAVCEGGLALCMDEPQGRPEKLRLHGHAGRLLREGGHGLQDSRRDLHA